MIEHVTPFEPLNVAGRAQCHEGTQSEMANIFAEKGQRQVSSHHAVAKVSQTQQGRSMEGA